MNEHWKTYFTLFNIAMTSKLKFHS